MARTEAFVFGVYRIWKRPFARMGAAEGLTEACGFYATLSIHRPALSNVY